MTDRLYFADPYLTAFDARIVARRDTGSGPAVVLDRTAFYPEGGGQPADTGRLDGVTVIDVQADAAGAVWHTLERPLTGDAARGEIDWGRRFDHMQQHHGQHLLSAAFERLFDMRTVSFHLGAQAATIDLAVAQLSEDEAVAAEELANRIIWEDHPVRARFVEPEELARIPLRKAPAVSGPVRVVSVADFDHSPCGGTHPRATGAVGLLHIRRWERRGGEVRVEFLCGSRAMRELRARGWMAGRLAAGLTVGVDELEPAIARLRESEERSRKRLATVVEQLWDYQARELLAEAAGAGGVPVVCRAYGDRALDDVKGLARAIAAGGGIALLGVRADKAQVVFAGGPGSGVDCGALLKETLSRFGGRGGGQPALAQGGLPDPATLDEALAAAAAAVRGAG